MTTARREGAGSGYGSTGSTALYSGGYTTAAVANTEEWAFTGLPPSTPAAGYADAITGDFYYNSSTGQFKNIGQGVGSWSSGGSLNTGRRIGDNGAGTLPAGLVFAGYTTTAVANTESYDGSSFTETGDLNSARHACAGHGATATAAFCVGGTPGPKAYNEHFDGSSWTEVADLNQARYTASSAGTQTASLVFGGSPGPGSTAFYAQTEEWDGSSWTEVSDLNTARSFGGGSGTSTAALMFGGITPPNTKVALTESWNGSSWTEVADLATAMNYNGGVGTSTAAFSTGGNPQVATTEEWNQPDFQIKTVTQS